MLALARLRYNTTMVEAFYLDPDELPDIDSETTYAGINVEFRPVENLDIGLSYVTAPQSPTGPNTSLRSRYALRQRGSSQKAAA
jgi:hypothetical protein